MYRVQKVNNGFRLLSPAGGLVYLFEYSPARDAKEAAESYAEWHNRPSLIHPDSNRIKE